MSEEAFENLRDQLPDGWSVVFRRVGDEWFSTLHDATAEVVDRARGPELEAVMDHILTGADWELVTGEAASEERP